MTTPYGNLTEKTAEALRQAQGEALSAAVAGQLARLPKLAQAAGQPGLSSETHALRLKAKAEAETMKDDFVSAEHVLLALAETPSLRPSFAAVGFDPVYGARSLRRYLQREVETALARAMLAGEIPEGSLFRCRRAKDALGFEVGTGGFSD